MKVIDDLNQLLVGRVSFPAVNYALNRKRILSRYRELLDTESLSQTSLQGLQFQRLRAVVGHAYEHVPFYRRRFEAIGLRPEDIQSLDDIRHIPQLLREDVIAQRTEMVDTRYQDCIPSNDHADSGGSSPSPLAGFRKRTLVRNYTSGSSGVPTEFYEDGSTTALNWVHELRLKHWYGVKPGAREARMFATAVEYVASGHLPSNREIFWNHMMLPGYFLSEREYKICMRKILQFRPRVLWGPTPALAGLARYILHQSTNLARWRPDVVISRAAPLYTHEAKLIADAFGCPVTNIYGTRELGHVAMLCPHGGMHVNQENYIVEVDPASSEDSGSTAGNILVTPLYETPMPFLRYRLGDVVEMGESSCPCGRSLMQLKKIAGRTGEIFKTTDGRTIEPNFWCIAFESGRQRLDVERFQVVYRSADRISLRIVRRPSYSAETEADLMQFIRSYFPRELQCELEYVSEIKPERSGKYRFVVNEIRQQEEEVVPA
jgi:phenylacetate-CoA ligase